MCPARARQREDKYLDPLEQPYRFLVPPLGRDGARCWLLTAESGLQQIPLLQVQVREGGR